MKMIKGFRILLIVFVLGFASEASAADYYVAPTGNDSNPGTITSPWGTVNGPRGKVKPGDTVYFRGGDYVITDPMQYMRGLTGAAGAPITYKNYQGEKPVIVFDARSLAPDRTVHFIAYLGGAYHVIDGLHFRMTEESRRVTMNDRVYTVAQRGTSSAGISVYGSNITIRNCSIDNTSGPGIFYHGSNLLVENCIITRTGSHGFYISGSNAIYRNNILDGSRGYTNQQGIQMQYQSSKGNKLYGNVIKNGQATGIVLSGRLSNNEVFNNVFINAGSKPEGTFGWALNSFCEDGTPGPGNKVYNNTFYGKTNSGLINPIKCTAALQRCDFHAPPGWDAMSPAECANELALDRPLLAAVEIRDNIFYPSTPVTIGASGPNIHNNIFYNITGSATPGNLGVNPMLTADGGLQVGSPAIDAGKSSTFPSDDFHGKARPEGSTYDIGAFEGAGPGVGEAANSQSTGGVGGDSSPCCQ